MRCNRNLARGLSVCWFIAMLSPLAAAQEWRQYRNERYGFSLEYPADLFVTERVAEAGDGHAFSSTDGEARLLVGALVNAGGHTPTTYQQYIARHSYPHYQIDYRRTGGSWFALSGENKDHIFYEKVMFTCGGRLINSFAMIYPASRRHVFDAVVERIEDTFRPATDCQRAGVEPRPPPPTRGAIQHQRYGERSELADRIARSRGYNVIVIVRRTTPPYDRRVLRGYASRR